MYVNSSVYNYTFGETEDDENPYAKIHKTGEE
jgi:hypothetical protein